jgi:membrane-associated phospholipid phosphatase
MSRLRSSELFIIGYFLYVAFVAFFLLAESWPAWIFALCVGSLIVGLSRTDSFLRDWLPLAYTLVAYREMDLFRLTAHAHSLERSWIVWDRWALDQLHVRSAIETLGWPLPFYLELCYLLVYAVGVVALIALLLNGRRSQVDRLLLAYLAGTLGTYALFPFFPSDPPRLLFPNADLPNVVTLPRQLNLWLVGTYGIHSSVFPSAHVSSAFSAAWGLHATLPQRPWIGRWMAIYGLSVAVATVYGRYHYAADAVTGIVLSLAAILAMRLHRDRLTSN